MTKRVLLAGLLGGIAMYVWTSVAHLALPLGQAGIKEIPNETAVLSALRSSLGESAGLYFFPGTGLGPDATAQQKQAAMQQQEQRVATEPGGILMYNPPGALAFSPGKLIIEFVKELIQALLVVILLAQTRLASFAARLGFVVMAGVMVAIGTNVSYWNWYGFPSTYTLAYMTTDIVGFICVGLIAAAIIKPDQAGAMNAPPQARG